MRHGSLFSGVGGFDLAAEWMGWSNIFQVEIDPYCQKVLAKNFPQTKRYLNIFDFDGSEYKGAIDIISGGFPCQPFSAAGKRKGSEDDRHLWPQMLRVIGEVQPRFVVAENVPGLLIIERGLVFERVYADLEAEGYEVQPVIIPACGKGAKHKRERIWFAAHSEGSPCFYENKNEKQRTQKIPEKRFDGSPQSKPYTLGRINGISEELDDVRIMGLGNAIVPQIALEIFRAIEQTENQLGSI